MCVIVSLQGGDQGSPSCKLLELGQMVNLESTMGKTATRDTGRIVCVEGGGDFCSEFKT